MRQFKCAVCGYVYDESIGIPEKGIQAHTKWDDLPDSFRCPLCNANKSAFKLIQETVSEVTTSVATKSVSASEAVLLGEITAICSGLAKGCEKQRLLPEMDAFSTISKYFEALTPKKVEGSLDEVVQLLKADVSDSIPYASAIAKANGDRGALRSLVWSEKVSIMNQSLIERYLEEGDAMLSSVDVYVCEICGFIHVGKSLPEICPVCKVPKYRIARIERR